MLILILGGGDLASGVALRLHRVGLRTLISELPQPLAVRRNVSFAEAVYAGEISIEGINARRVKDPTDKLSILTMLGKGDIPVLIDPDGLAIDELHPAIVVDARMRKQRAELIGSSGMLIIGLGPGFDAGINCSAVIETQRGPTLGRVYWQGEPLPDNGLPDPVGQYRAERVLRSPTDGIISAHAEIGDILYKGQLIASVNGQEIRAPFDGVLRGLIYPGLNVNTGLKIGDLDPRGDPNIVNLVSDKALAIGGGVLEAILSKPNLRTRLWS